MSNVIGTITLLGNLGFVLHPKKSVFIPTQILVYLGFVLNSIHVTVSPTLDKANKLKTVVTQIQSCKRVSIREVAQVVGLIICSFPGVMYDSLHYRT